MAKREEFGRLALLFFALGFLSFGGPIAHLALFDQECVKKRAWMTREEFVELIAAANLLPGPNSTQVAFAIGLNRAGFLGMLIAGVLFIAPGVTISGLMAWLYVREGSLPALDPVLVATKAAMIGVILGTAIRLAPSATKSLLLVMIGVLGLIASVLFQAPPVLILLASGILGCLGTRGGRLSVGIPILLSMRGRALAAGVSGAAAAGAVGLLALFGYFLYVGATIYGGGFVLVSYLQAGLVRDLHWITNRQLLDAITVGQLTPGPVFSTATFVGFLIGGVWGAVVATIGIFLPCFVLVPAMQRLVTWARRHPKSQGFLDGVSVSAISLILSVGMTLAPASAGDLPLGSVAFGAGTLTLLRVNPAISVLCAGLLGWALHLR